ncbi:MAG: SpoIIE family protein phosphatase [candidate division Zixibacteria bacterium]|nr:SpoIIE family protein phosphatase [candidate division Zixibacteria bacterium]
MHQNAGYTRTEKLLLEAARMFNDTNDYEELMHLVLRLVLTAVNAEAALVFRIDHDRTDMKMRLMKAADQKVIEFQRELGPGVFSWVAQFKEPLIVNDARNDPRSDAEIARRAALDIRSIVSVPLIGKGKMIGVVEAFNKNDGGFSPSDLDILTGLNNQIAVAIDNAHLYRELKREALEKNTLYEVGISLSKSLDLDEVLHVILDSLQRVVPYDAGGVFLIDPEEKQLRALYTIGYPDDQDEKVKLKIGQGLIGHVATTGAGVIVPDVSVDPHYVEAHVGTKSEVAAPIKVDDRMVGVLNLASNGLDAYSSRDLKLLTAFASQAAISIERARLHARMLGAKQLEEQLNIARAIQQSFLPQKDPKITGYEVTGRNVSSGEVGGDYYDFIPIVGSHTGIAIGDVSGKGMPAALIMASFRASLIAEIRNNYSIRTICAKVNSLLWESLDPGNYVTAVYGVLDARNHIFTFSNCGHNPPIMLRANGSVELLSDGGPILGVTKDAVYEERAIVVNPGDTIVLYTDGVTEVFDEAGQEYGVERLVEVIKANRARSVHQIQDAIYSAVTGFCSADHIFDDLTMVVVKRP